MKLTPKKRRLLFIGIGVVFVVILFLFAFYLEKNELNAAGQASYNTLTSEQKQAYWDCFKTNKCSELLTTKKNKEYQKCSLSCNQKATESTKTSWCKDSDNGDNFFEKGIVKSNIYLFGKEDSCYTFPDSGKTYLFEGRCKNNKYQYLQKDCKELGKDYACNKGTCIEQINGCVEDKEVLIPDTPTAKLEIDLCTHLKDSNGIKYYFFKEIPLIPETAPIDSPSFFVILAKEIDDINYRYGIIGLKLDYFKKILYPEATISKITLLQWDGSLLHLEIENTCDIPYPLFGGKISWCDFKSNSFDKSKFTVFENLHFNTVVDNELYPTEEERKKFTEKRTYLNKKSSDFLINKLDLKPIFNKTYEVILLGNGGAHANLYIITTESIPISFPEDQLIIGNTHELTHIFFSELPVIQSWFGEGLADYMRNSEVGYSDILCKEKGWYDGYLNLQGEYIKLSPLVPYSDFSLEEKTGVELYDPFSRPSYYHSAECFWKYIEETYGEQSLKNIAKAWQDTRKINFKEPKKQYWLINDIINPVLGTNLSSFVYQRYNYIEQEKN